MIYIFRGSTPKSQISREKTEFCNLVLGFVPETAQDFYSCQTWIASYIVLLKMKVMEKDKEKMDFEEDDPKSSENFVKMLHH